MNYTRRQLSDPWPARILFIIVVATTQVAAQPPAQTPAPPATRGANRGGGFAASYPQRPPGDPAVVARGKALYGVHCNFCHDSDARAAEGGPNLPPSELPLNDQKRELTAPVA